MSANFANFPFPIPFLIYLFIRHKGRQYQKNKKAADKLFLLPAAQNYKFENSLFPLRLSRFVLGFHVFIEVR